MSSQCSRDKPETFGLRAIRRSELVAIVFNQIKPLPRGIVAQEGSILQPIFRTYNSGGRAIARLWRDGAVGLPRPGRFSLSFRGKKRLRP